MEGSSAKDMLARYCKLIEHGDPLARHIDKFVHYSLEHVDMLDRFSSLIQHREPLAHQVDELVRKALAHHEVEAGRLPAAKSGDRCSPDDIDHSTDSSKAAGTTERQTDVGSDSPAAVKSREGSPVGRTDDRENKDKADGEAVAQPDVMSSAKHRSESPIDHLKSFEDSDTVLNGGDATSATEAEDEDANTFIVADTSPSEAIANFVPGLDSAHTSTSAHFKPPRTQASVMGTDASRLDVVSAAVSSHGLAAYVDPRNRFMRSQIVKTKNEADSSFVVEVDRATTGPPLELGTAPSTMSARPVVLPGVQKILEYCRKRKSTEEDAAVHKSRKPNPMAQTLDGSGPHADTFISSTPGSQTAKYLNVTTLGDCRESFLQSAIANVLGVDVNGPQDISEALTAAWAGSELIEVSTGTSESTFVICLQKAAKDATKTVALRKNSTSKTVKGYRTEFVCVMHATLQIPSALRLQAGILRIVSGARLDTTGCNFAKLFDDQSKDMDEDTFRGRMKALYEEYDIPATKYCDSLWSMVRKMILAYKLILIFEAVHGKRNEKLVNSIIADLFPPSPASSDPNRLATISQRQSLDWKLAELKSFHEIATMCGGPGIFCILPEKCLTKIRYARGTFRSAFLQSLTEQCPAYKELGRLLTKNVLTPVIDGDKEALRRLPLFNAELHDKKRAATLTWHALLTPPMTG